MITDSFGESRVGAASEDDKITNHVVSVVYRSSIKAFVDRLRREVAVARTKSDLEDRSVEYVVESRVSE